MIYGENSPEQSEQISVSFAYGSIVAAASDTTPGSINFGYDEEHKAGAIFRMGKLVTSRIIDIVLDDNGTEDAHKHKVTVKFIDEDGVVRTKEFDTVDESLVRTLISNEKTIYVAGNYIEINENTNEISVSYNSLYDQIKDDLANDGIRDNVAGNYIDIDESTNEISVAYDSLYAKVKGDLANEGIGDNTLVDEAQTARLKEIEKGYAASASVDEAVEGGDTVKVTVGLKSRENPNSSFIINNVEFNVPTNSYYERIDSSLNELVEEIAKKQDKDEPGTKPAVSMEWLDVEDLLSKVSE